MSDLNNIEPSAEEMDETSDVAFRDPFGDDPAGIPDPMPDDLQVNETASEAADDSHNMEGEAPTS